MPVAREAASHTMYTVLILSTLHGAHAEADVAAVRAFYETTSSALDCELGLVQLQGSLEGSVALRVSPEVERWPGDELFELALSGGSAWRVRDALHAEAWTGGARLVRVRLDRFRPPDGTFTVHLERVTEGAGAGGTPAAAAPEGVLRHGMSCGEACEDSGVVCLMSRDNVRRGLRLKPRAAARLSPC